MSKIFTGLLLAVVLTIAPAAADDKPLSRAARNIRSPDLMPSPSSDALEGLRGNRAASPAQKDRLARMQSVDSWGYQLRFINPYEISGSPFDLVVVDHAIAANRRFVRELSPGEVAMMQRKPDGGRRIVLAYLSIGEAERYRFYWTDAWYQSALAPTWLGPENPRWQGNYRVAFWDKHWQALLYGGPGAYLERIVAQGFDGIYIDRADIYEDWAKEVPDAEVRMADLLQRLTAHARALKPELLVVMQNGEDLLRRPEIVGAIDGFAKEDLLYGVDHKETPNGVDDVEWSYDHMRIAQAAGRRVLVVEYLSNPETARGAARRIGDLGFVPYIAPRGLDFLVPDTSHLPVPVR